MDISANQTLNIATVCLGFAIYDVQLSETYRLNFFHQGVDNILTLRCKVLQPVLGL